MDAAGAEAIRRADGAAIRGRSADIGGEDEAEIRRIGPKSD